MLSGTGFGNDANDPMGDCPNVAIGNEIAEYVTRRSVVLGIGINLLMESSLLSPRVVELVSSFFFRSYLSHRGKC